MNSFQFVKVTFILIKGRIFVILKKSHIDDLDSVEQCRIKLFKLISASCSVFSYKEENNE